LELFGFFVIWLLFCIGVGALADSRGRSGFGYFLLSFLLSPLLGLIVVLVARNIKEEDAKADWRRRAEENREFDRKREHEKQLESLRVLAATTQKPVTVIESASPKASVADELEKLASLRDRGFLTPEEFDGQKRVLLQTPQGQ
jgi:hypothetical protein